MAALLVQLAPAWHSAAQNAVMKLLRMHAIAQNPASNKAAAAARDIHLEIAGREPAILQALGILLPAHRRHIRCPFPDHEDQHPSWRWDAGPVRWFCTCGNGTIIDAVMRIRGLDFASAVAWIREQLGIERPHARSSGPNGAGGGPKASDEAPDGPEAAPHTPNQEELKQRDWGIPSAIWTYHNAKRQLVLIVARYDATIPGGFNGKDKTYCPWTYGKNGRWHAKGLSVSPLYRLPALLATHRATVVIFEGEKDAEGARLKIAAPNLVFTTTAGGAEVPHKTDFGPLAGRNVIIVPDNDAAGYRYRDKVAQLAREADAASIRIAAIPAEWKSPKNKAWGFGDPPPDGTTLKDLQALLHDARDWAPPEEPDGRADANPDSSAKKDGTKFRFRL